MRNESPPEKCVAVIFLSGVEQQPEVRGPDAVGGVEAEGIEHPERALSGRLDVVRLDLCLDLDELAESVDLVERDGVAREREPTATLPDRRRRLEPQPVEDTFHRAPVGDGSLELLAGLRAVVHERPLVRHHRRAFVQRPVEAGLAALGFVQRHLLSDA